MSLSSAGIGRRCSAGLLAATLVVLVIGVGPPGLASAASPEPTPSTTAEPLPTPAQLETPAQPTPSVPSAAPLPSKTPESSATPEPSAGLAAPSTKVGSVPTASGSAVPPPVERLSLAMSGPYYEDIGSFRLTGALTPARAGAAVVAYWYHAGTRSWVRSAAGTTDAAGRYSLGQRVGAIGTYRFRTTLGPPPGTDTVTSVEARAAVRDATIALRRPASRIDAVTSPRFSGVVVPARAGVRVSLDVVAGGSWRSVRTATTDAAGRYAVPFGYDVGALRGYTVRASYRAANRPRTEVSAAASTTRVAVLNAASRATTRADVAKTYRSGCPVGPSRLRTVAMNYYGYDRRMHRGVIIIRSSLADDLVRAFGKALKKRYPIAKMNNPNVYNGNDPRQMAANNTSGFNCRKVVGNPLRQSPHSYGIAIDVNTVQNPYRDAKGKWWPSNGKKYIKRSPVKKGMLTRKSALTKQLRKDDFFWGGFWNPGRDYQHFEKR